MALGADVDQAQLPTQVWYYDGIWKIKNTRDLHGCVLCGVVYREELTAEESDEQVPPRYRIPESRAVPVCRVYPLARAVEPRFTVTGQRRWKTITYDTQVKIHEEEIRHQQLQTERELKRALRDVISPAEEDALRRAWETKAYDRTCSCTVQCGTAMYFAPLLRYHLWMSGMDYGADVRQRAAEWWNSMTRVLQRDVASGCAVEILNLNFGKFVFYRIRGGRGTAVVHVSHDAHLMQFILTKK